MDLKSRIDQAFADRKARLNVKELEKQRAKEQADRVRNAALELVLTTVEPVLREFEKIISEKGYEISVGVSLETVSPRVNMKLLIPSQNRSVSWPASELTIVVGETVGITWEIWGPKGRQDTPVHIPKGVALEVANREWIERHTMQFISKVTAT